MNIKELNERLAKTLKENNNETEYEIPFSIVFEGTIYVSASDKESAYSAAEKLTRENDSSAFLNYTAESYLEGTEIHYEVENEGTLKIDYSNYKNAD